MIAGFCIAGICGTKRTAQCMYIMNYTENQTGNASLVYSQKAVFAPFAQIGRWRSVCAARIGTPPPKKSRFHIHG